MEKGKGGVSPETRGETYPVLEAECLVPVGAGFRSIYLPCGKSTLERGFVGGLSKVES